METTRRDPVQGSIRLLFEVGTVAGLSDGQLLDRFLDRRADVETAEVAFAALVERHGPMVLRACRSRLGDEHDAQDAFQATFLILARKAGSIRKRDSASSWLQGVARRVASCARRQAALRRAKEHQAAGRTAEAITDADRGDLVPAVREEVGNLPEKYRTPLMLCLLDGLTHEEAATHLGWPVGTVKTRVRHAKDRLRTRLARRGLAPSLATIGSALAAREASAIPPALVRSTARAALGSPAAHAAPASSIAALVQLGLRSLTMSRMKVVALVITSLGALAAGATGLARSSPKAQEKEKPAEARPDFKPADPVKPVAAEVAEDDLLDQMEMARLDLEVHRKSFGRLKGVLTKTLEDGEFDEPRLNALRSAKTLEDLHASYDFKNFGLSENETFEAAKERIEGPLVEEIDRRKEDIRRLRDAYSRMARKLRREEEKIKELEARGARIAPAGATSEPRTTADIERRLSEVERKLDLILKALESRGREPRTK